jgi:hypothetical protein
VVPQDDETRIAEAETRLSSSEPSSGKPASHVSSSSGWLSTSAPSTTGVLLQIDVITLDPALWFFPASTTLLLIVSALAVYGFHASRGGEPLLGKRILD